MLMLMPMAFCCCCSKHGTPTFAILASSLGIMGMARCGG